MDRISTEATKIQIFDLNWHLFLYWLTVIMSFLYLITFFIFEPQSVVLESNTSKLRMQTVEITFVSENVEITAAKCR